MFAPHRLDLCKLSMALGGMAAKGLLLGACAAVLGCSPSHDDEVGGAAPRPESAETVTETAARDTEKGIPFWMKLWGPERPDAPMYLRLPIGVDTRGWEPMTEGFDDWMRGQKRFNRPAKDHYAGDYDFTWDPFTWNIPLWRETLAPFVGRPDLRYLEIGIAEGRSLLWMLENVLTDPTSRATGIDPFLIAGHEERLHKNLAAADSERVEVIKGFSQDVLPELEPQSYDLIYIDGSHLAGDVLFDSVYTWRLLRDGGLVIHDDYMWKFEDEVPPDMRPLVAVDAFITGRRNTIEVVHRGRQLILRKRSLELPDFCWNKDPCLRIGNYLYAWNSRKLLEIGTGKSVPLTKTERAVLKGILRSRRIGADAELVLEEDIREIRSQFPEEFERLATRLDLNLARAPGGGSMARGRVEEAP